VSSHDDGTMYALECAAELRGSVLPHQVDGVSAVIHGRVEVVLRKEALRFSGELLKGEVRESVRYRTPVRHGDGGHDGDGVLELNLSSVELDEGLKPNGFCGLMGGYRKITSIIYRAADTIGKSSHVAQ